jgi:hypothetical protein
MKRHFIKAIFLSLTLFQTSCFGLFDSGSDRITGKYIVLWIDLQENQGISEEVELNSSSSIGLVPEYVFAVGHDNDFIIAKQHPTSGFENGFEIDTTITNYYVIDMNRKILKTGEKVFGPLSLAQFDSIRPELKIQNIKFDKNYPNSFK